MITETNEIDIELLNIHKSIINNSVLKKKIQRIYELEDLKLIRELYEFKLFVEKNYQEKFLLTIFLLSYIKIDKKDLSIGKALKNQFKDNKNIIQKRLDLLMSISDLDDMFRKLPQILNFIKNEVSVLNVAHFVRFWSEKDNGRKQKIKITEDYFKLN